MNVKISKQRIQPTVTSSFKLRVRALNQHSNLFQVWSAEERYQGHQRSRVVQDP